MRVAQRNPRQAHIIQPLGQVGQFGRQADITNADSVRNARPWRQRGHQFVRCVRKQDARRPRRWRSQCRRSGARRRGEGVVQVSAIGAHSNRNPPTAAPRPRARMRPVRRFRTRRSCAHHWCSALKTISPTDSRQWPACRSFRSSPPGGISSRSMSATSPRQLRWPRSIPRVLPGRPMKLAGRSG